MGIFKDLANQVDNSESYSGEIAGTSGKIQQRSQTYNDLLDSYKEKQDTWYRENLGITLNQEQKLTEQDFLYSGADQNGTVHDIYKEWYDSITEQNNGINPYKSWKQALYANTVGQEGWTNPAVGEEGHLKTFGKYTVDRNEYILEKLKEYSENLSSNGYTGEIGSDGQFYSAAQYNNFINDLNNSWMSIEIPEYLNAIEDDRSDEQLNNIVSNYEQFNVGNEEDYTYAKQILQSRQDSANLRNIQQSAQFEQIKAKSTAKYWTLIATNPSEVFDTDQYKIMQAETGETGSHYLGWIREHRGELGGLADDAIRAKYMTSDDGYNSRVAELASTYLLYGRNGFTPSQEQYAALMGYTSEYEGLKTDASETMWNSDTYSTVKIYTDANGKKITETQFKENYDNYIYDITDKFWEEEHGNIRHYKPAELQEVIDGIDAHLKYWYCEQGRTYNTDLTQISEEDFNIGAKAAEEIERLEKMESELRSAHDYETVSVSTYTKLFSTLNMYTNEVSRWYMNTFSAPICFINSTVEAFGGNLEGTVFGGLNDIADQVEEDNLMFSNTIQNTLGLYSNESVRWIFENGLSVVNSLMDMGFTLTLGLSGVKMPTEGILGKIFDTSKYGEWTGKWMLSKFANFLSPVGPGGISLLNMWGRVFNTTFADMNAEVAKYTDAMGNRTYSVQDVWLYALESAFTEYFTEKLFGTILSPYSNGKEFLSGLSEKLTSKIVSQTGKNVIALSAEMIGEGLEEVISEFMNPVWQAQMFGTSYKAPTFEEAMKAFAGGALCSFVTGGTKLGVAIKNDISLERISFLSEKAQNGTITATEMNELRNKARAILNRTSSINHSDIMQYLNSKGITDSSVKVGDFLGLVDTHIDSIRELSKNSDFTAEDILKLNQEFVDTLPEAFGKDVLNLLNQATLDVDENYVPKKNESGKLTVRRELLTSLNMVTDNLASTFADIYLTSLAFPETIIANQRLLDAYSLTHTTEEMTRFVTDTVIQIQDLSGDNKLNVNFDRNDLKNQREGQIDSPIKITEAGQYRAMNIQIGTDGKATVNQNGVVLGESQASDALGIKVADDVDTLGELTLEDLYTEDIAVVDFMFDREYMKEHKNEISESISTAIVAGITINNKEYVFAGWSASNAKLKDNNGRGFRAMFVEKSKFAEVAPVLMGVANYNIENTTNVNGWQFNGPVNLNKFFVYAANAWSDSKVLTQLNSNNFILVNDVNGEQYSENLIGTVNENSSVKDIYTAISQRLTSDKITDGSMYKIVDGDVSDMTTQQVRGGVGFKGNLVPVSLDGILMIMDDLGIDYLGRDINGNLITRAQLIKGVKENGELYIAPESVVKLSSQYKTEDGKYDMDAMYRTLEDKRFALRNKLSYDSKHEETEANFRNMMQLIRGQDVQSDEAKQAIASLAEKGVDKVFEFLTSQTDIEQVKVMLELLGITEETCPNNATKEILQKMLKDGDIDKLKSPTLAGMVRQATENMLNNMKEGKFYVDGTRIGWDRMCRDPYAVMERMMLDESNTDYNVDGTVSKEQNTYGDLGFLKEGEMIVPNVDGKDGMGFRFPVATGKNTVSFTRAELDEKLQKLYPKDTVVEAYRSAAQHVLDADYDGDTFSFTVNSDLVSLLKATQETLNDIPLINFDHAKSKSVPINDMLAFKTGVVDAVRAALSGNDLSMYDNWINIVYSLKSLSMEEKQMCAGILGLGYILCIDQVKTGVGVGNIEELYKANPENEAYASIYNTKKAVDLVIKKLNEAYKNDYGTVLNEAATNASNKVEKNSDNIFGLIVSNINNFKENKMQESRQIVKDYTNLDYMRSLRYNQGRIVTEHASELTGTIYLNVLTRAKNTDEVPTMFFEEMAKRGIVNHEVALDYLMDYITKQTEIVSKAFKEEQAGGVEAFGRTIASYSKAMNLASNIMQNLGYQFPTQLNEMYESTRNTVEVNFADLTEAAKNGNKFQRDFFAQMKDRDLSTNEIADSILNSLEDGIKVAVFQTDGTLKFARKSEAGLFDFSKLDIIKSTVTEGRNSNSTLEHITSNLKNDAQGTGNLDVATRLFDNLSYKNKTWNEMSKDEMIDFMAKIAVFSQNSVEQTVVMSHDVNTNRVDKSGNRMSSFDCTSTNLLIDTGCAREKDRTGRIGRLISSPLRAGTMFHLRFGSTADTGFFLEDGANKVVSNIHRQMGMIRNIANELKAIEAEKSLSSVRKTINGVESNGASWATFYKTIKRGLAGYERGNSSVICELLLGHYLAEDYNEFKNDEVTEIIKCIPELDSLFAKAEHQHLTDDEEARIASIVGANIPMLKGWASSIEEEFKDDNNFEISLMFETICAARVCPLINDSNYRNYGDINSLDFANFIPMTARRVKGMPKSNKGAYDQSTRVSADRRGNFGKNAARRGGTVSYNIFTLMDSYCAENIEVYYGTQWADEVSKIYNCTSANNNKMSLSADPRMNNYINSLRGMNEDVDNPFKKALGIAGSFFANKHLQYSIGAVTAQHASYHQGHEALANYLWVQTDKDGKITYSKIGEFITNPFSDMARKLQDCIGYKTTQLIGSKDMSNFEKLGIDPETGEYTNNILSYISDFSGRFGEMFDTNTLAKAILTFGMKGIEKSDLNTTYRLTLEALELCIAKCASLHGYTNEQMFDIINNQDTSTKQSREALKDFNYNYNHCIEAVMQSQPGKYVATGSALSNSLYSSVVGQYKTQPFINIDYIIRGIIECRNLDPNSPTIEYDRARAHATLKGGLVSFFHSALEFGITKTLMGRLAKGKRKKWFDEEGNFQWDYVRDSIISFGIQSMYNSIPFVGTILANKNAYDFNEKYGLYNNYLAETNEKGYIKFFDENNKEMEYNTDYYSAEDAYEKGYKPKFDLSKSFAGEFGVASNIIDLLSKAYKGYKAARDGVDLSEYDQQQGLIIAIEIGTALLNYCMFNSPVPVPATSIMTDIDKINFLKDDVVGFISGDSSKYMTDSKVSDQIYQFLNNLIGVESEKAVEYYTPALNADLSDSVAQSVIEFQNEWSQDYREENNGYWPDMDNKKVYSRMLMDGYNSGKIDMPTMQKLLDEFYNNQVANYDITSGKTRPERINALDLIKNPIYSDAGQKWGLTYDSAPFFINAFLSGDYANVQDASERFWEVNTDGNTLDKDEAKEAMVNGHITSQAEIDMFGNNDLNNLYDSFMPSVSFIRAGADENSNYTLTQDELISYLDGGGQYNADDLTKILEKSGWSTTTAKYKKIKAYADKGSRTASTASSTPSVSLPTFDYSLPSF